MQKPQSRGIVIEGGTGNHAYGNIVIGYDVGVHLQGGSNNRADGNLVLTAEAIELYARLKAAISSSTLQAADKARVQELVTEMKAATGEPSFVQKYKDFMAVLADHMQVLGPLVAPLLPGLSSLLPT